MARLFKKNELKNKKYAYVCRPYIKKKKNKKSRSKETNATDSGLLEHQPTEKINKCPRYKHC